MGSKKEGSAEATVFTYLRDQNRPYSVNDMVLNLHKEHGKTAIQKGLDKLVQEGKVREKTYGKQKVYLINQTMVAEVSPEELRKMDKLIEEKEKNVKELEASVKAAQAELRALSSSITTEEARAQVDQLTKENAVLQAKFEKLSENTVELLDKAERDKIRSDRVKYVGEYKRRKKMCMEMANMVLDNWPGTKDELYEAVGVETDEAVEFVMPVI